MVLPSTACRSVPVMLVLRRRDISSTHRVCKNKTFMNSY